jgi:hypothetical protein
MQTSPVPAACLRQKPTFNLSQQDTAKRLTRKIILHESNRMLKPKGWKVKRIARDTLLLNSGRLDGKKA